MLFEDAVKEMLKGNYVSRNTWDANADYLVYLPGMQFIWKIMTQPQIGAGNWQPMMSDFLADDWKVVSKKDHCDEIIESEVQAA